jgi:hypothetical protein
VLLVQAAQANLEALWQLFHRAIYSSQCSGLILLPLLLDAISSLVGSYAAHCEGLLATAGAYLSLAVQGVVEPAMQQLVELCERREREVAAKVRRGTRAGVLRLLCDLCGLAGRLRGGRQCAALSLKVLTFKIGLATTAARRAAWQGT